MNVSQHTQKHQISELWYFKCT